MADIRTADVDDLLTVLAKLDEPDDVFALLEDLFTVREIRETSQRLLVARLLAAGKSYAAIEAETGASATTIARVSKCLSYGSGGYKRALARPAATASAACRALVPGGGAPKRSEAAWGGPPLAGVRERTGEISFSGKRAC